MEGKKAFRRGLDIVWNVGAGALAYVLITGAGTHFALQGADALFFMWGVTQGNIAQAPLWVRLFFTGIPALLSCVQLALIGVSLHYLKRAFGVRAEKEDFIRGICLGCIYGVCAAMVLFAALVGTDVSRISVPLWRPRFSLSALLISVGAIAAAACAELFARGYCMPLMLKKSGRISAYIVSILAGAALNLTQADINPWAIANRLLLGLFLCGMFEKTGSAMWGVGFRCAFSALTQGIFGFTQAGALYETYPVRLYWLNGGEAGPASGAIYALVLCALIILFNRRRLLAWRAHRARA